MESYHPAVGMWAAAIKYQMSGKNGVSKVKMNDAAYAPANEKAIPIIKSAGITPEFITSDDEETELFLEALQIFLDNLRANNEKDFYIANPDQDPNVTLIKQQQELIKARAAAAAAAAVAVASPLPPIHIVGRTSLHDDNPDSITIGGELSKVKACHAILGAMPVKCLASTSGVTVKLAKLSPVLEGALTTKGGHYEKARSYKEQLQTYMGKCSCDTCDFLQ
eukprot:12001017-Ditylum_brightwellii.AAC.1